MHFAWDAEQQTFRSTVRAFLAANLPSDWESLAHGPGSESQSAFSKRFCAKLAEAGLLVPHWPKRWGGRDAGAWAAFILAEEMWEAGEPRGGQYMNVNWIGPTLMRFGSESSRPDTFRRWRAARRSGARDSPSRRRGPTWPRCARAPRSTDRAIASTARRSGLPMPGHADTCFLLARTAPGRDGISVFLVPMDTPGIIVREIPSLIGEGDIHEVFWDNVEVPEQCAARRRGAGMGDRANRAVVGARRHPAICARDQDAASGGGDAEDIGALRPRRDRTGREGARGLRGGAFLQLQHRRSAATWNTDGPRGERRSIRHRDGRASW